MSSYNSENFIGLSKGQQQGITECKGNMFHNTDAHKLIRSYTQ